MNAKRAIRDLVFKTYTSLFGDEKRMVRVPVLRGPNRGARLKLDLSRFAEPGYLYGTYDKAVLQTIQSLGLKGKTVWECGTYIGYYTTFLARQVGRLGRVIAFEPDPNNLKRTEQNCVLNNISNVILRQFAIGAPVGETAFAISGIETNSHLPGAYIGGSRSEYVGDNAVTRFEKVMCISLDQALLEHGFPAPDLIKIDIEGAELLALDNMEVIATKTRPTIILELHNPECDNRAWDFAQKFSYELSDANSGRVLSRREDVHGTLLCRPLERVI